MIYSYNAISVFLFAAFPGNCSEENNLDDNQVSGQDKLKACTFNIPYDNTDNGYANWQNRKKEWSGVCHA